MIKCLIKKETIFFCLPIILIGFASFWIQINLYVHKDVALVSHIAKQILQGQTYTNNIFDSNPPIIFYLNFLPVIISKFTGISMNFSLRIYVIFLGISSIFCSKYLLKILFDPSNQYINNKMGFDRRSNHVFSCVAKNRQPNQEDLSSRAPPDDVHRQNSSQDRKMPLLITYGLTYILLFLPSTEFGQREHFYIILTIPYIFLTACRLNAKSVNNIIALLVGITAGIGFSIKPFFFLTLILIELSLRIDKKNTLTYFRIESLACFMIIFTYGMSILFFYPTYLSIIIPFWFPYYQAIAVPWKNLITTPSFIWCCSAIFLYLTLIKKNTTHIMLKRTLLLSIIGNLIAYLIPQVTWYYHILPALSLTCLYFIVIMSEYTDSIKNTICPVFISTLILILLPITQSTLRTMFAYDYFHSDNTEKKIISLLDSHKNQNNYISFSMTHNLYSLELYSSARQVGSFSSCTWEYTKLGYYSQPYQNAMRAYALNIITHDLITKKPQFIIVDISSSQTYLKQTIDFPKEYNRDSKFHAAWSHYTYLTSIQPYDIYQRTL